MLQDYIDTFWFCDTHYQAALNLPPVLLPDSGFRIVQAKKDGVVGARSENRKDSLGLTYKFLKPSRLNETYERLDGYRISVIRRRGYGQIAISAEFCSSSIGVFMHRRDSPGDGGSKVFFLGNFNARYAPCGRLFDQLSLKLTDRSLIISDGSNSTIPWVKRFHDKRIGGSEAYRKHSGKEYEYGCFRWRCVGWLSNKYGPTLVWGLTRK